VGPLEAQIETFTAATVDLIDQIGVH